MSMTVTVVAAHETADVERTWADLVQEIVCRIGYGSDSYQTRLAIDSIRSMAEALDAITDHERQGFDVGINSRDLLRSTFATFAR